VAVLGITTDRAGRVIRRPGVSPAKADVHRRGHSLVMAKADVLRRGHSLVMAKADALRGNNKVKAWPGAALRGNKAAAGILHQPLRVGARVVLRGSKVAVAEAKAVTVAAVADEAVKEDKAEVVVEVVALSRLTIKRDIASNKRKCGYPTSATKRERSQKSQSVRDVGANATTCKNQPSRRAPAFAGA
jgi:hypothetical protein